MSKKAFTVVEKSLSDNSKVYSVQGSSDDGAQLIVIECNEEKWAYELVEILSERTFGIHVQSK